MIISMRIPFIFLGVSNSLGLEETEVCGMHDGGRIGQCAVGALVRTKQKVTIISFPEGQMLLKKAHALAVHFSYSNRLKALHEYGNIIPNQPTIKLHVDLIGTRVVAQHITEIEWLQIFTFYYRSIALLLC